MTKIWISESVTHACTFDSSFFVYSLHLPAMELNKLIIIRSQSNITPKCVPLCVCVLTCYIRTHSISIFTLLELIIIDTSSEQLNAKYLFSLAIPVEKGSNAILTLYFELPKSIEFNLTLTNLPKPYQEISLPLSLFKRVRDSKVTKFPSKLLWYW